MVFPVILRLHVTSSPPCWKTITKDFSLASFVYGTNMAATSLSSLGNDCKPRIVLVFDKFSEEVLNTTNKAGQMVKLHVTGL
jgi:hypothetical protein